MDERIDLIRSLVIDSIQTKEKLLTNNDIIERTSYAAKLICRTLRNGGKVVLAGNGGSASDCLHIAGEIVGRFQKERKPWPAVVLNADVATMTAIANDYGYDEIFARQVEGHINAGDIFVGISTSGNSENIIKAIEKAHELGGIVVGFMGKDGGKMKNICDVSLIVPSNVTARIQESHIMLGHIICDLVEKEMTGEMNE